VPGLPSGRFRLSFPPIPAMPPHPADLQIIGDFIALRWSDGREDALSMEALRAASPSAANKGETDLFGNVRGGDPRTHFPGVRVNDWEWVGNYAIRFIFSDGHQTGLFSYPLLRALGAEEGSP
jgi:DUF971 family protein